MSVFSVLWLMGKEYIWGRTGDLGLRSALAISLRVSVRRSVFWFFPKWFVAFIVEQDWRERYRHKEGGGRNAGFAWQRLPLAERIRYIKRFNAGESFAFAARMESLTT